jgi:hypothetical protein
MTIVAELVHLAQASVEPALVIEITVRPLSYDRTCVQQNDSVDPGQRSWPMRDDDEREISTESRDRLKHSLFCGKIQRRGRFIKYQERGVAQ